MEARRARTPASLPATRVGIRELRHDFRTWLDRARAGERIVVTDRGEPVVDLVPHEPSRSLLQQMYDRGEIVRARHRPRPAWAPGDPISTVLSTELQRMRHEDDR